MKNFRRLFLPCAVISGLVLFSHCKKSESVPPVSAVFTVAADATGKKITFTNTSENADTYTWRFGDNTTSTEANPTHTYDTLGLYKVVLVAKSTKGSVDSTSYNLTVTKGSVISLTDGVVSDWSTIPVAYTVPDGKNSVIKEIKFDYKADNIFIYIKQAGTLADSTIFMFFVDTDNDSTTGYKNSTIWPKTGFNLYFQLNLKDPNGNLYNGAYYFDPTAAQNAFTVIYIPVTTALTVGARVESSGIVESEYGITRSQINSNYVMGKKVRIGIEAWLKGWAGNVGDFPNGIQAPLVDMTR